MTEIWRPIPGLEGFYEANSVGRVRSCARDVRMKSKRGAWATRPVPSKVLSPQPTNSGYLLVMLSVRGARQARTVHSLVAAAFLGPRPAGMDVAHADGTRTNNAPSNLRYATRAENHADKRAHGTAAYGSRIKQAKLTEAVIPAVRALQGSTTSDVAAFEYGVTRRTIERCWARQSWAHVA
jgi:hypothetical protein